MPDTTLAIEWDMGQWVVIEYDNDALARTIVFAGTQDECERYVRENENA